MQVAEQFLTDDVYQDIVHTIEQMTRAMERTPTDARSGEEEIRDLILFVLNANYEGNVRGEVFNKNGKTDLLLTWEVTTPSSVSARSGTGQDVQQSDRSTAQLRHLARYQSRAGVVRQVGRAYKYPRQGRGGDHPAHVLRHVQAGRQRYPARLRTSDNPNRTPLAPFDCEDAHTTRSDGE